MPLGIIGQNWFTFYAEREAVHAINQHFFFLFGVNISITPSPKFYVEIFLWENFNLFLPSRMSYPALNLLKKKVREDVFVVVFNVCLSFKPFD